MQAMPCCSSRLPYPVGRRAARAAAALQAAFGLFHVMKDVFLPTDQDWLSTRFRIAAKKRWHFLEGSCGYEQMQQFAAASVAARTGVPQ